MAGLSHQPIRLRGDAFFAHGFARVRAATAVGFLERGASPRGRSTRCFDIGLREAVDFDGAVLTDIDFAEAVLVLPAGGLRFAIMIPILLYSAARTILAAFMIS
jgi:hypothetical protein